MAQHSTRLQNLTHADIIRIGANFENELRNELKAAADLETERKVWFDIFGHYDVIIMKKFFFVNL